MGSTLIVDDPELVPVFYGTHLPTSEWWNAELAYQREEVGISIGMTSTGHRTRVACKVAQWFTHYAKACLRNLCMNCDFFNIILFTSFPPPSHSFH